MQNIAPYQLMWRKLTLPKTQTSAIHEKEAIQRTTKLLRYACNQLCPLVRVRAAKLLYYLWRSGTYLVAPFTGMLDFDHTHKLPKSFILEKNIVIS